jgi:hypothetical protein
MAKDDIRIAILTWDPGDGDKSTAAHAIERLIATGTLPELVNAIDILKEEIFREPQIRRRRELADLLTSFEAAADRGLKRLTPPRPLADPE